MDHCSCPCRRPRGGSAPQHRVPRGRCLQAVDVGLLAGLIRLRAADGDDDDATVGELDVGPAQGCHLAAAQRPVEEQRHDRGVDQAAAGDRGGGRRATEALVEGLAGERPSRRLLTGVVGGLVQIPQIRRSPGRGARLGAWRPPPG